MRLELESIVSPRSPDDFSPEHPLRAQPRYWDTYAAGLVNALGLLGRPVVSPEILEPFEGSHTFRTIWQFSGGARCVLGVDYSDHGPHSMTAIDALMAMRWHPNRKARVRFAHRVFAAGFPISIGWSKGDVASFLRDLPRLRRLKDESSQSQSVYFNRGHFRTVDGCSAADRFPNRSRFQQSLVEMGLAMTPEVGPAEWHQRIASHAWALNLCGEGNSIDRKVVELCAIGTGIFSDRGLEDLLLPWGIRFAHQENILFVDDPTDMLQLAANTGPAQWRKLVDGSRAVFDRALSPSRIAEWFLHCAVSTIEGKDP
jgi:hypothetical protein